MAESFNKPFNMIDLGQAGRPKSKKRRHVIKREWQFARYRIQECFHTLRGRKIIHLLHIGKTGGTAVKYALRPCGVTPAFLIRRHGHQTRLSQIPNGQGVIFFLRDPQTRFVSGFFSRLRQGQPRYNNPSTALEKSIFERFPTPNHLALALYAQDEKVRHHAEQAMRSIAHVRDSYLRWFVSEDYFLTRLSDIFFIGFQENLDGDFQLLKIKLGIPGTAVLPDDDILAHRSPPHLDRTLDEEAVRNIKRWYAADYSFFDLCKAQAKQINAR